MTVSKSFPSRKEFHRDEIEPANPTRGSNETFGVTGLLVSQLQNQIASENEIDSFYPGGYGSRPLLGEDRDHRRQHALKELHRTAFVRPAMRRRSAPPGRGVLRLLRPGMRARSFGRSGNEPCSRSVNRGGHGARRLWVQRPGSHGGPVACARRSADNRR